MSESSIKILFLFLIPIGIALIAFGISKLRRSISAKPLIEISYAEGQGKFTVHEEGKFSVWIKGGLFRKAPAQSPKPVICDPQQEKQIHLSPVFFRTSVSDFSTSRLELYTFHARKGDYLLVLSDGQGFSLPDRIANELIPLKTADPDKVFLQVRESHSRLALTLSIIMIVSGGVLTVGALIMAVLAPEIFN
ncbi:MAG: hypothetical protein ACXIUL_06530 [Wenzhouxiangella sp.]